jgi:large subunit ribosomal protein L47
MEFFDEKKNWGEREVKVGRSWKLDELRLKSNEDLHKLWYVLLKEKNMLLTMQHDAKEECRDFANPERIDKVEESMGNLEEVVRERNKAYFLLETGTTGERTGEEFENWLGLPEYRQHEEYPVPKEENKEWFQAQEEVPKSSDAEKRLYYSMLRSKQRKEEAQKNRADLFTVYHTLMNFPDMDLQTLREKVPDLPEKQFNRAVERSREKNWENNEIPWEVKKWNGQHVGWTKYTWRRKYMQ